MVTRSPAEEGWGGVGGGGVGWVGVGKEESYPGPPYADMFLFLDVYFYLF